MIREIARDGREAIARGDYSLIDSAEARGELFKRVTGRIPAAKPTQPGVAEWRLAASAEAQLARILTDSLQGWGTSGRTPR